MPPADSPLPNGTLVCNGVVRLDTAPTFTVGKQQFHVVEALLVLVQLLGEYLAFQDLAPMYGGDIAHRAVELCKVRSQTCLTYTC